ncbi:ribonuclease H-like domain-containing protein [Tanacetum coccineum]
MRSFGCLAYATILNSHDKFGSRFEKCVLVGYSNFKKGYKLWSLDNRQVIFSRDDKFFEDIFPFKQNISSKTDNFVQDVNHLNFFNINTLDDLFDIPNDEERMILSLKRHGTRPLNSGSPFTPLNENDGGHSQGVVAAAGKGERYADLEENIISSEGDGLHNHPEEVLSQSGDSV